MSLTNRPKRAAPSGDGKAPGARRAEAGRERKAGAG